MDAKGSARFYCSATAGAGKAAGFTPNHLDWPLSLPHMVPSRPGGRQASHVGSLPLQPRIVGSRNCVPGVHVPVHAHGDALLRDTEPQRQPRAKGPRVPSSPARPHLLGVVQGAARLPDALPKALVRHPLRREPVMAARSGGSGCSRRPCCEGSGAAWPFPATRTGTEPAPPGPVTPPDLQELLCVGHGDLHLHLLHNEPRVQLAPAASSGAEIGAEAALHCQSPRPSPLRCRREKWRRPDCGSRRAPRLLRLRAGRDCALRPPQRSRSAPAAARGRPSRRHSRPVAPSAGVTAGRGGGGLERAPRGLSGADSGPSSDTRVRVPVFSAAPRTRATGRGFKAASPETQTLPSCTPW